ncbi:putative callose synthase 8 isoform X1 [Cucurbita maxima]|uniref:1,3-beta-glucan synthase n=3 Tax=Cucurbita maxima TaxID=3661 RepID=A0A6J1IYY5_CUCMA|nr:putative callose synthase 8 isoform X1 [Cucurbita maxima]
MAGEIVLSEPIVEAESDHAAPIASSIASTSGSGSNVRGVDYNPEPFESERLPVSLASEIQRFLRVANSIEREEPRIACLCRFHAFVIAHNLDRYSNGRGVRQLKTALLQRLEQDEEVTIRKRKEKNDPRELRRVYHTYKDFIIKHGGAFDFDNSHREKLINARRTASVLYEVLKSISTAMAPQAVSERDDTHSNSFYVPYNILPLDHRSVQQPIMQLPEIKAAVAVISNVRGLPSASDFQKNGPFTDLFDFLQWSFGFQRDNVANQREHLILLLANMQTRLKNKQTSVSKLGDNPVDELMIKFFKNYTHWCKFLGRKSNIRLPYVKQEGQQYKLLYIGLYLLIWGEAANLRFMPECLCYIFHHMAYELHGMLTSAVSLTTWEKVMPAYGGGTESFLENVVSPIYRVIKKEAEKSNNGSANYSTWRNYDDLNEYFWSPDCFELGWPLRLDHDFFHVDVSNKKKIDDSSKKHVKFPFFNNRRVEERTTEENVDTEAVASKDEVREQKKSLGKSNFVEVRSFLQIFRSFKRMWSFYILSLQAMIIMAFNELDTPLQLFDAVIFEDVSSVFVTSSVLKLLQAIIEITFTRKARRTMGTSQKRKYLIKLGVAVIWTIVLPVCYAYYRSKYKCYTTKKGSWIGELCFSSYMVAVAIYLISNAVDLVLFLVPAVGKYIETSNGRICSILSYWTEPRLYVGRGMQESQVSMLKYTLFWVLVLLSKFSFSYYFEIKPLVEPTKRIMKIGVKKYDWHELFPKVRSNAGAIVAIWAPIIVVYFMDSQIWYSVFCTIFGGLYGILHHLGEIRTLGMLRSRFHTLPYAFNACFCPPMLRSDQKKRKGFFRSRFQASENTHKGLSKFVVVWNQIIKSFRHEDLINNRELDLMTMPVSSELFSGIVRWPVFLLANKFTTALSIAKEFVGKDANLIKKIKKDEYMSSAVKECYESLKYILEILIVGDLEKRVISSLINEIEESINRSSLLEDFKMNELPVLHDKCIELLDLLIQGHKTHRERVIRVLQDIFELVTSDMMTNGSRLLDLVYATEQIEQDYIDFSRHIEPQLFESSTSKESIHFPLPDDDSLKEQIKRFHLLLTVKDSAMDIPVNLEARRRISFFATSMFMNVPKAPKVSNMMSFSVLTPYFAEDISFSLEELHSSHQEVSIIFYMQKMFPDECKNFLERLGYEDMEKLKDDGKEEELRNWASFRGQTLSRTVRGMMYYREALKLQAFLDIAEDEDILEGYDTIGRGNRALSAQIEALADMKFTYVLSCQSFGAQKACGDPRAKDILDLMIRYPSLRVAYVEEKEMPDNDKVYSSKLIKAVNGFDQEIYSIKLPGPPHLGEGKPENQNHAIIFTRGEALQTVDMNQDNYFEEALKMRNLLQEFFNPKVRKPPAILGLREHIFTGSVSSLAWFMSYQETSFVTIGQRILANPLRVRFHYGHPDVFDRVFHITRGGISKASRTINLSEDVYAGFNSTLRRGYITYHEYMQIGKGRDVGLNQISKFEAKIANGNSEQTLSRDIYRLGQRFDFFRMLSCYYTTIGYYFSSLISVLGIYVFLYGQLYLVLSGLEKSLLLQARMQNVRSLETALASQSFIQLGLLTGLPMVMEIGLERGFLTALKDFVLMQLQLAVVFFTFSLGTKTHYFGRTILHGGAKYRPTGRKVVVFSASFTENYRLYSRSHFVKGFELLLLLVVYDLFRRSYQSSMAYMLITYSIWFMSITWLFAPFLFNPSGFSWAKIVDDWKEWNKWIKQQGGIGVQQDKSWQSWWDDEQAHLRHSGLVSRLIEVLLSLRFFIYQYGLVYHLDISQHSSNFLVYVLSWAVIAAIFLLVKAVNLGKQQFSANYHFVFRLFKAFLFLGVVAVIISLSVVCHLSLKDMVVCSLAFLPTGWGLTLFAQTVRPTIEHTWLWDFTRILAKSYDYGMGVVIFAPVAMLAWLPNISDFQTRFLFNEAFNRHLHIQPIIAGKRKHK